MHTTTLRLVSSSMLLAAPAGAVFAQSAPLSAPDHVSNIAGIYAIVCSAVDWVYSFVMIAAVIAILIAAFQFLTSGGSEERIAGARRFLTTALVGVAIAVLAKSIIVSGGNFLGADLLAAVSC